MKREHYIPFDKGYLLEKLLLNYSNEQNDAENFKRLFDIMEHYIHYEAFNLNHKLKDNYGLFDPDLSQNERDTFKEKSDITIFKNTLSKVLERGNYECVDEETLKAAFENSDLIGLKLAIDFNAYKEYKLYVRGHHKAKETVTKYLFWKKEIELEYYDRVLIYLYYEDADQIEAKKVKTGKHPIEPGCIVLKIFKRVPKNDLETIFPNAIPQMSNIDKLLFWVPGVGGGISLLSTKVIPALVTMNAAIKSGETLDLLNSKASLYKGLIALGVLGGYLFRQYSSFINKKIKYSKMLSDSLYFKNLGNNSGAFYSLLNSSEEEELKETLLAYAFLNQSKHPLTAEELDHTIESWFKTELNSDLDFDVEDALKKIKNIGLGSETDGKWSVISIKDALVRLDEIWDNIFDYNNQALK